MAVKKLLRMGDKRLLNRCESVDNFHSSKVQCIINDLIDSMRHYGGAGIAAPQIGYFLRIVVFGAERLERYPNAEPIPFTVLINPEIDVLTQEQDSAWEGCLSVPGYRGLVPRYTHIRYRGYDAQGQFFEREAQGFHARCVQHEVDHIDGILYPMRIEDMRNFGCDDILWERWNGQPYPESLKQKLREYWGL